MLIAKLLPSGREWLPVQSRDSFSSLYFFFFLLSNNGAILLHTKWIAVRTAKKNTHQLKWNNNRVHSRAALRLFVHSSSRAPLTHSELPPPASQQTNQPTSPGPLKQTWKQCNASTSETGKKFPRMPLIGSDVFWCRKLTN